MLLVYCVFLQLTACVQRILKFNACIHHGMYLDGGGTESSERRYTCNRLHDVISQLPSSEPNMSQI